MTGIRCFVHILTIKSFSYWNRDWRTNFPIQYTQFKFINETISYSPDNAVIVSPCRFWLQSSIFPAFTSSEITFQTAWQPPGCITEVFITRFLDASTHLYMRVCTSIGPLVRGRSYIFLIAEIDKSNKPANLTNLTESDKSLSAIQSYSLPLDASLFERTC